MCSSPGAATTEAHVPRACTLKQEKPPKQAARSLQLQSSPCSPQPGKSPHSSADPGQPRNKSKFSKKSQENALSPSPPAGDPDDLIPTLSQVLNKLFFSLLFSATHLLPSCFTRMCVCVCVCVSVCVCRPCLSPFFSKRKNPSFVWLVSGKGIKGEIWPRITEFFQANCVNTSILIFVTSCLLPSQEGKVGNLNPFFKMGFPQNGKTNANEEICSRSYTSEWWSRYLKSAS